MIKFKDEHNNTVYVRAEDIKGIVRPSPLTPGAKCIVFMMGFASNVSQQVVDEVLKQLGETPLTSLN